jgi:hypothetical protein
MRPAVRHYLVQIWGPDKYWQAQRDAPAQTLAPAATPEGRDTPCQPRLPVTSPAPAIRQEHQVPALQRL